MKPRTFIGHFFAVADVRDDVLRNVLQVAERRGMPWHNTSGFLGHAKGEIQPKSP